MNLYFRKSGKGTPFIILHGLYGSSDNWFTFGKILSKQYEVFLVDQRNHGRSPHTQEHNYDLMVQDLAGFFEQHQIGKAIVMGHSMGGKTALLFALQYPALIDKLVVVDSAPKSYEDDPGFSKQLMQHKEIVSALVRLDLSLIHSREEADKILAEDIPDPRVRSFLLKNLKRHKNGRYSWILNIDAISRNLESIFNGFDRELWKDAGKEHYFPALFITGQLSNYVNDSDKKMIPEFFPNARIETIPGAGHWVHADQPDLFLNALLEFLQQGN